MVFNTGNWPDWSIKSQCHWSCQLSHDVLGYEDSKCNLLYFDLPHVKIITVIYWRSYCRFYSHYIVVSFAWVHQYVKFCKVPVTVDYNLGNSDSKFPFLNPFLHICHYITVLFNNTQTLNFTSQAVFAAINDNYNHKQWTLKLRRIQNGLKTTNQKLRVS